MSSLFGIGGGGNVGASGSFYSHTIDQSLRFNDNDSAYLSRTPSSAGSLTTWTWSGWVKRGNLAAGMPARGTIFGRSITLFGFFNPTSGVAADNFGFYLTDGEDDRFMTNRVFRDTSAWYHFVVVLDTTNSTANDRFRLYVNGVRETSFSRADAITQNRTGGVNAAAAHAIGRQSPAASQYFDGYLAEMNFIDGTALTADSFGETKDGVWIPKEYTGSYGTNGFYLPFDDSSAIGDDKSGNTNDWTVNNLVATDVVPDSPTNNFATLNPIHAYWNLTYPPTINEGNLRAYTASNFWATTLGNMGVSSGKWYAEFLVATGASPAAVASVGILDIGANNAIDTNYFIGYETNSVSYYGANGTKYISSTASAYGNTWGLGDIIGIALDLDAGTVKFYKNNTVQNSGAAAASSLSGTFVFGCSVYATTAIVANFGQDSSFAGAGTKQNNADDNGQGDFYYAPPSGHLAVCSSNLTEPTIIDGSEHFNTVLWTGTGSGGTRSISGLGFSPDWVWAKNLTEAYSHTLYDSVRGAGNDKELQSNDTAAEGDGNPNQYGYLSAFDSDGFTSTSGSEGDANNLYFNESSKNYAAWNWLAGTAFSASVGSISTGPDVPSLASSGQVNTKAGFSIVSYSGSNSAATFAHGLSNAPELVIIKQRNNASFWATGFAVPDWTWSSDYIQLQDDAPKGADGGSTIFTAAPSSTVVSIGGGSVTSTSGKNLIAYCFHSVEGYSKIGQYEGNNLADGTFVYTGFRPAFLLVKNLDAEAQWLLLDNKRDPFNVGANYTSPDLPSAFAAVSGGFYDLLSNGFKWRLGSSLGSANAANTYVYYAVAEQPFKFSNAR